MGLTPVPIGGNLTVEAEVFSAVRRALHGTDEHRNQTARWTSLHGNMEMTWKPALPAARLRIAGWNRGFRISERPHTAHGAEVDHGLLRTHDDRPEFQCPRLLQAR